MSKKKYNKARPGHYKTGSNFAGYKKGYEPKLGKFREPFQAYTVNEGAIAMLKEYDEGGGFKRSSGAKAHRAATDKLRELEFDPLEELIKQLNEIEDLLLKEQSMSNPRIMVINNLINCKTRILENLLPYRYGKAPTLTVESADIREPIKIVLEHDFTINDKTSG
jgi:hypothetical protein